MVISPLLLGLLDYRGCSLLLEGMVQTPLGMCVCKIASSNMKVERNAILCHTSTKLCVPSLF